MVADCAIFGKDAPDDDELRANARLIAAAPDLYEACRMALVTGLLDVAPAIQRQLEAALAKAEGKQ